MIFPIETIPMPGGCIAQEARYGGRTSPRKVGVPRIKGRPQIIYEEQRWLSARLSYHLNISCIDPYPDLKSDQLVLHSCDNGWCIAPGHLRLGTQTENMIDKSARNENYRATRGKFSEEVLLRLADAARRRKGEKRPNSWWRTEEVRAKAADQSKAHWSDPERRATARIERKAYASSEIGKKQIKEAIKKRWNKEGAREEASLKCSSFWADPDRRKAQSERIKKSWENRKRSLHC